MNLVILITNLVTISLMNQISATFVTLVESHNDKKVTLECYFEFDESDHDHIVLNKVRLTRDGDLFYQYEDEYSNYLIY